MRGGPGFTLKVTGEIDKLTLLEAGLAHVIPIHENDTPAIVNTAIAVIETVNTRVELIVAADGHHPILSRLQSLDFDSMNGEFGFPLFVRELAPIAGGMWQVEEPFRMRWLKFSKPGTTRAIDSRMLP